MSAQMTQHVVVYDHLTYRRLRADGADLQNYHEFCSAFDNLTRGQSFERICIDLPTMLQWLRDDNHRNNNAGRTAFSETLHAIHPDIDYLPKQTYAAANFSSILGPVNPQSINYAALPRRPTPGRDRRTTPGAAEEGIRRLVCRSPARLSCYARGFRLAALPVSKHRTMTDELTVINCYC
jgi:hypothetical protein